MIALRSAALAVPGSVDRAWRLVATALAFALFGLGGLVMALVVFPLCNLAIRSPARRAQFAQHSVHMIWRLYIAVLQGLGVLTYECHGEDLLRTARGTLVVANHPTLLDVVFLMAFMRRTRAVVKAGVWRNPFMRGVVAAADYVPNLGDPERLIEACAGALRAGANLVIFPEGSRSRGGGSGRYQRGFAYVALAAAAPIRVVSIRCDPPTLRKGEPWHRIPPRRPHWIIRVDNDPIDTAEQYGYGQRATAARQLTVDVERRIERLLRHD
jgi:1-acyl-sn-glycerol-3-phosphate acyltransferase